MFYKMDLNFDTVGGREGAKSQYANINIVLSEHAGRLPFSETVFCVTHL